MGHDPWR